MEQLDIESKQKIIKLRELLKKNAPIIYKRYAALKIYKQHGQDTKDR